MEKIVRLTESELTSIIKRVVSESMNLEDPYFVDEESVYTPMQGYAGGYWDQTVRGTPVWLQNKAQTNWPTGDAVKTKKAALKLIKGLSGLDITGKGAKLAQEVANEWKTYSLVDQNEFLRQWYKLVAKRGEYFSIKRGNTFKWGSPWSELLDDNERGIANQMITNSIRKVNNYCKPYADKKTNAARSGKTVPKNVICDLFVTNDLRNPGWS